MMNSNKKDVVPPSPYIFDGEALSCNDSARVAAKENDLRRYIGTHLNQAMSTNKISTRRFSTLMRNRGMSRRSRQVQKLLHTELGGTLTLKSIVKAVDILGLEISIEIKNREKKKKKIKIDNSPNRWRECFLCEEITDIDNTLIQVKSGEYYCLSCVNKVDFKNFKEIEVDFNVGQDKDGLMALSTTGALESIAKYPGISNGDFVLLTQDNDIGVGAMIFKKDDGWFAHFDWEGIFDLNRKKKKSTD